VQEFILSIFLSFPKPGSLRAVAEFSITKSALLNELSEVPNWDADDSYVFPKDLRGEWAL
jgi:hypothetical protein